jgi:hypothetical protein
MDCLGGLGLGEHEATIDGLGRQGADCRRARTICLSGARSLETGWIVGWLFFHLMRLDDEIDDQLGMFSERVITTKVSNVVIISTKAGMGY